MFEKKTVIASAILAGLVSGIALAAEPTPATTEGAKMEKKNECKGHKDDCKGKKHQHKKKGDKDACSGPNGCNGMDKSAKKEGAVTATPTPAPTEKKAK